MIVLAIVKQKDKRSGITYVYESLSYWDKEKKQPRSKRTLIGRLDPESGKILPTDGRGKRRVQKEPPPVLPEAKLSLTRPRFSASAAFLLRLAGAAHLDEDLAACFPGPGSRLLSVSFFLLREYPSPLRRIGIWTAGLPCAKTLSRDECAALFGSVTEKGAEQFFRLRCAHLAADSERTLDIVSLKDPSGDLPPFRFGKGRGDDLLSLTCLALCVDEASQTPFAFGEISAALPDPDRMAFPSVPSSSGSGTLLNLPSRTEGSILALLGAGKAFLCVANPLPGFAKEFLTEDTRRGGDEAQMNLSAGLRMFTRTVALNTDTDRPRRKEGSMAKEKAFVHLYFSPDKLAADRRAFDRKLMALKAEWAGGKTDPGHEKELKKYFEIVGSPKKGLSLSPRGEEIENARRSHGFFVLVSNVISDPETAYRLFRRRQDTQAFLENIKERMNTGPDPSSGESFLYGKLFTAFLSLILLSQFRKETEKKEPFSPGASQAFLDAMDMAQTTEEDLFESDHSS